MNSANQLVIRNDSDFDAKTLEFNSSYQILPNHTPSLNITAIQSDYKRNDFVAGSFSGPNRSNTNLGISAGWNLNYKGLLQGRLATGYSKRYYDDPQLEDIDAVSAAGGLNWNFNTKSTLSLSLRRSIAEDNDVVQGAILSQQRLQLDHEFLHNLFLNAFIDKALINFTEIDRDDDIYRFCLLYTSPSPRD